MDQPKLRVLLADDHILVRDGLKRLINDQPGMDVVAEAGDGDEAIQSTRALLPDVAVIDISMPRADGLTVAVALQDLTSVRLVALTRHDDQGYVDRMMHAGAAGYVLKQSPSAVLVAAIESVARGERFLDPSLGPLDASYQPSPSAPGEDLTEDEGAVLRLIAAGCSQSEISQRLHMPRETVSALKGNAMRKAHLIGRVDILRYAVDRGWLRPA